MNQTTSEGALASIIHKYQESLDKARSSDDWDGYRSIYNEFVSEWNEIVIKNYKGNTL